MATITDCGVQVRKLGPLAGSQPRAERLLRVSKQGDNGRQGRWRGEEENCYDIRLSHSPLLSWR